MTSITSDMPSPSSKLRALLESKRTSVGEEDIVEQILTACDDIPKAILADVKDKLAKCKELSLDSRGKLMGIKSCV